MPEDIEEWAIDHGTYYSHSATAEFEEAIIIVVLYGAHAGACVSFTPLKVTLPDSQLFCMEPPFCNVGNMHI